MEGGAVAWHQECRQGAERRGAREQQERRRGGSSKRRGAGGERGKESRAREGQEERGGAEGESGREGRRSGPGKGYRTVSGKPARNMAILHSLARWEEGPSTEPITTSPAGRWLGP